jgi:hypothetical protein
MFRALKSVIESAYESSSLDLKSLQGALDEADADADRGQRDAEALQSVHSILGKLWSTNSGLLSQAAEVLANGSRDREFCL